MHHYRRNLGDYYKKASRLSMLEHGAYNLLIDACYDREIFPTREEAIEWTWASSPEEVQAVEFVLGRFFILNDDGRYEQKRIREEVEAYSEFCERQRSRGKKGGRPRDPDAENPEDPKNPEPSEKNPAGLKNNPAGSGNPPKKTLTNNPLTNNPLKDSPIVPKGDDIARQALELLAEISGRKFKPIESNLKPIRARLADGHSSHDIGIVLRHQWLTWRGTEFEKYYRPSTLFRPSNFEGYLNDANNPQKTTLNRSTREISLAESLTDTSWANP